MIMRKYRLQRSICL